MIPLLGARPTTNPARLGARPTTNPARLGARPTTNPARLGARPTTNPARETDREGLRGIGPYRAFHAALTLPP